jgi:hypothetical protein
MASRLVYRKLAAGGLTMGRWTSSDEGRLERFHQASAQAGAMQSRLRLQKLFCTKSGFDSIRGLRQLPSSESLELPVSIR